MQKAGSTVAWRLTCNRGFAVPPLDGNVAMCAKDGSIIPLNYCQEDSGCDGLKAVLALYKDAQPISTHNCKMSMSDGDTCRVQCPAGYSSVGFFACMAEGQVFGKARCVLAGQEGSSYGAMVAGTLQCKLDAGGASLSDLSAMLKDALVTALQVPIAAVLRVLVSLSDSGRRLIGDGLLAPRRLVTETYAVTYELGTTTADAAELAQRVTNLASGGTLQNTLFTSTLKNKHNVVIQQISVSIAPRVFVAAPAPSPATMTTAPPKEEGADIGVVVGSVIGVLAGAVSVCFCLYAAKHVRWLLKMHNES